MLPHFCYYSVRGRFTDLSCEEIENVCGRLQKLGYNVNLRAHSIDCASNRQQSLQSRIAYSRGRETNITMSPLNPLKL